MLPLVLYDLVCKLPGNLWSPNTTKTRYVLSYKNLPFETVWLEFPDIAAKCKEIGASPYKGKDGSEQYIVPVLSDPNTGALITESWTIAEYLDKTYPEKPVFPNGTKGLIAAFDSALEELLGGFLKFIVLRVSQIQTERGLEYFLTTRQAALGEKVDEWSPEGPKRDAHWKSMENGYYGSAKTWYDKVEGKWLMGDTFSYADILLAARTFWYKKACREDEWNRIAAFHGGRWKKLLADVEKECNVA